MNEPSVKLDASNIDDYIEHMEQQQNTGDARYIQDLHYLYRKEEILTRARQRLLPANSPNANVSRSGEENTIWSEHSTIRSQPQKPERRKGFAWPKLVAVLAAALLLLGALFGTAQFFKGQTAQTGGQGHKNGTPPTLATITPTPANTVLFSDPLKQNSNNWIVDNQHFFKNGAYHVNDLTNNAASALLEQKTFTPPWSYSLTMTQLQGDTTSAANSFGLIFAYTRVNNYIERFYTFEFTGNSAGGELALFSYDNSQQYPWQELWSLAISKNLAQAFHAQAGKANTLEVIATANSLTLMVNDRVVGTVQNIKKIGASQFGMLVNLKGSEVAFQNMLVTRP